MVESRSTPAGKTRRIIDDIDDLSWTEYHPIDPAADSENVFDQSG